MMNEKQEKIFKDFAKKSGIASDTNVLFMEKGWQACLDANGITQPPNCEKCKHRFNCVAYSNGVPLNTCNNFVFQPENLNCKCNISPTMQEIDFSAFERLAYAITKATNEMAKSFDKGIERANEEDKLNAKLSGIPDELKKLTLEELLIGKAWKVMNDKYSEKLNWKPKQYEIVLEGIERANEEEKKNIHCYGRDTFHSRNNNHPAPDWVIEMMKTGKPVKCMVRTDIGDKEIDIVGYSVSPREKYIATNGAEYTYAEPVTEWKPKQGDVVFANIWHGGTEMKVHKVVIQEINDTNVECFETTPMTVKVSRSSIKPFDASKIGNPWDEI